MTSNTQAYRAILNKIITADFDKDKDLTKVKLWGCKTFGLKQFPKNSDLLAIASDTERETVLSILKLKPVRSISGVTVITVMPKPYPCPKERPCTYCPGGLEHGTPQSYTGREPAGRRAIENDFDPFKQVRSRINQFQRMGHTVDKVELIIFGGTLTAYPTDYFEWFVIQCLNALSSSNAHTIEDAQVAAEHAKIKNSDITIETRPDYCKKPHIDFLLRLGVTRIELGVQTIFNDIYKQINRGHTIEDVIEATRIAKEAGYVVIYHMMPGLMGADITRDLTAFNTIFQDERFKPDAVKIYPTLVIPGTELYTQWKKGEYKPYSLEETVELIAEIKKNVPRWVRIQRIQRDIPSNLIADGVKRGDLRNLIKNKLKSEDAQCECIRCREIGHAQYLSRETVDVTDVKLIVNQYSASQGEELFLSFENASEDILIGSLRLRVPSQHAHKSNRQQTQTMLVRELHVYGPLVNVGQKPEKNEWQHRKWGERLLDEAERISKEKFDANSICILAGIGTRNYYRRFGYERKGPYMVKYI